MARDFRKTNCENLGWTRSGNIDQAADVREYVLILNESKQANAAVRHVRV
jgi:hypothetical protein